MKKTQTEELLSAYHADKKCCINMIQKQMLRQTLFSENSVL